MIDGITSDSPIFYIPCFVTPDVRYPIVLNRILTYTSFQENLDSRRSSGIGYTSKVRVRDNYHIVGFISSGTYGRVYKAIGKKGQKGEFAIKK